jgi:tRNA pseudouridine55 synthase
MQQPPFGILNINKPAGMTSRRAVNVIQQIVKPAKVGHAGTLDPLATGVLVVCVGRATRLIEQIQSRSKRYRATFLLGRRSDTDDVTGNVSIVVDTPDVVADDITALLPQFTGRIEQVPPAFSAVHVAGQRAYKLARRGKTVELAARPVEVYDIRLIEFTSPALVIDIHCGSGTYVRSIARDLGELLGCGAVMSKLVRTAVGPYAIDASVDPNDVTTDTLPGLLLPPTTAIAHLPQYRCTPSQLDDITCGRPFALPEGTFEVAVPDIGVAGVGTESSERSPQIARSTGGSLRSTPATPSHPEMVNDGDTIVLLTPEGELAALVKYSTSDRMVVAKQVFRGQN